MTGHVLLNLLNELGEKIRCEAVPSILSGFPDEFNKFNNTGVRMQDSISHMTLKSHFHYKRYLHQNVKISPLEKEVICIFDPLVDYRFLMHGLISLSDATSCKII